MNKQHYNNFTVLRDDAGVCRIILDVPGKPLNVLDHSVMGELEQIVAEIEQQGDLKLVVFKSGKESGFLAGADIDAINAIRFSEQAERLLLQGQHLFDRIERLPMPTLAILHGPCLGGGLELALACDYRIARDNSSTRIGLPEIKLGVIPGWGGTQRLPALVGLKHSLSMILSGKHLSADEALQIGLIDIAIPPDRWRDEMVRVIELLRRGRSIGASRFGVRSITRLIEAIPTVRRIILSFTRKKLARKSKHYPAIESAINAIADSYRSDVDGFETERREFGRVILTPTCRQLLRLFTCRERARNLSTWAPNAKRTVHREPIRKLGVIGAGAMGAGIAQAAITRGYRVSIKEANRKAVEAGAARIAKMIDQYCQHKEYESSRRTELLAQCDLSDDFDSFSDADLVIEAVIEKMDVKQSVLADAEKAIGKSAILATNTSALSVTEMAKSLERPDHFAGLHFFNPVPRMELVEVVRGETTSEATIARLVTFVRALGKTPIVTSDSPGFLVNRILFPYLGEAILMVREGYSVAEIDGEIRRFGMPMGPLELLDKVGLDVALHVSESLKRILDDVDQVAEVLAPMVAREETGVKSGLGFYDHFGKRPTPRDPGQLVGHGSGRPDPVEFTSDGLTDIQRRLIYPMLAESIRCEEESVVEHSWAIDLAMVLGTGFAPHRGGPLRVIDQIGVDTVVSNLEQLRSQFGRRFTPPQKLVTGAER